MTISDLGYGLVGIIGVLWIIFAWYYLIRGIVLSYRLAKQKKRSVIYYKMLEEEGVYNIK